MLGGQVKSGHPLSALQRALCGTFRWCQGCCHAIRGWSSHLPGHGGQSAAGHAIHPVMAIIVMVKGLVMADVVKESLGLINRANMVSILVNGE